MLIEIRLMPGKSRIRGMISRIRYASGLGGKKVPPHMSIYGPHVRLSSYHDVAKILEKVAQKYGLLPFLIDGYGHNKSDNGNVISLDVKPSEDLVNFRKELCRELSRVAPSHETWDNVEEPFWFHITLSLKMTDSRFGKVWDTINQPGFQDNKGYHIPKAYLPMDGVRITCLNDRRKIEFEYDLIQKRMLSRSEALSKPEWQKTLSLYRRQKNLEAESRSSGGSGDVFLISDLHLGHANIIRYCARPFANVHDMDRVLVNNWNKTVNNNDEIYYLGDLTFGRGSGSARYWLSKLNGKITYVGGNHDSDIPDMKNHVFLKYKQHSFLLIHDPKELPVKWDGWTIHGDKHNNDIWEYPFINGKNKTINVSAELINYQPLDIEDLIKLKFEKIERMDTLSSKPIYF